LAYFPELLKAAEFVNVEVDNCLAPVHLILALKCVTLAVKALEGAFCILTEELDLHVVNFVVFEFSNQLPEFS
jgi:hypothetical protein